MRWFNFWLAACAQFAKINIHILKADQIFPEPPNTSCPTLPIVRKFFTIQRLGGCSKYINCGYCNSIIAGNKPEVFQFINLLITLVPPAPPYFFGFFLPKNNIFSFVFQK